jgi:hypothetical protein
MVLRVLRFDDARNFGADLEGGADVRSQINRIAELQEVLLIAEVKMVVHVNDS